MNNLKRIMSSVANADIDAVMLTSQINRLYATGFDASDAIALITADSAWFFTDSRYIEAAENTVAGAVVQLVNRDAPYSRRIKDVIESCSLKRIGFEENALSYAEYTMWAEKLGIPLVPSQSILTRLREVKSTEELEFMKQAQRTAEKSFLEILPLVSPELTEKELAAELLYRFLKNGAEDKSFDTIAVSGVRSSMPHGVPSDTPIGKGFLTIDFGVKQNGWCSDTTRTVCIGKPTDEMRHVYDTVLNAQLAGIEAARAGVTGREIDAAARKIIEDAGYGNAFGHGFGHGLGLEVHESPSVAPSGNDPIPAGAVISAEPGIYLPGKFGVRIEDVLFISENGSENITSLPKELIIL